MIQNSTATDRSDFGINHPESVSNPMELVLMLYDGSIESLEKAIEFAEMGNIEDKKTFTDKARGIIGELQNTLDIASGGEVAENLSTFYLLLDRILVNAVEHNDTRGLNQVIQMLSGVREAWQYVNDTVARD